MDNELRMRLLSDLIDAIQDGKRPGDNLNHLWVHFFAGKELVTDDLGVAKALDCLMNNVYYFGDYDLSDADRLEVHVH